uniref:Hydrolase_4 domain-containing protein n=1 Tax=Macrostomum lignano TaxID=282301 RepID=A0A1I8F5W9_9PLAT
MSRAAGGIQHLRTEMDTTGAPAPGAGVSCHGFAEHCGYFHQLAEPLAAAGFLAVGHDFYGHGLSEGKREPAAVYRHPCGCGCCSFGKLKLEFPDCIVYGVGYSMGALVLHRMCGRSPQPPLSAMPAGMKLTKRRVQLSKWLLPRLPNLPLPGGRFRPEDLTRSKETQLHTDTASSSGVLYTRVWRLDAGSYASNRSPGSITLHNSAHHGTADRIADSGSICALLWPPDRPWQTGDWPGLTWAPGTSCTLDLPTLASSCNQDLMQWFAASQD